jgi:hypothetical protein
MLVIGLDLAGVESRPTGFCLLEDVTAKTTLLYTDTEIVKKTLILLPKLLLLMRLCICRQDGFPFLTVLVRTLGKVTVNSLKWE